VPHSFERLSVQDASFILFEGPSNPMHVGALALLEAGPLQKAGGGIDVEAIRTFVASRLPQLPRYRQRLAFTPVEGWPVWVDDERFDLSYHVRHTALPRPGTDAQLKELAGQLLSQPLDRARPLWEIWVAEGLEGDRFAVLVKTHHCMVDGVAGIEMITTLFLPTTDRSIARVPRWRPRPVPSTLQLLVDGAARRIDAGLSAASTLLGAVLDPRAAVEDVSRTTTAVWHALRDGLHLAVRTPFNLETAASRRIEWCDLDMAEVKEVRKRLDGTVNDVVLAVVSGALRECLKQHAVSLGKADFRVVVPVNVRTGDEAHARGNHVSAWFVSLPLDEPDPLARFERVRRETQRARDSKAADGISLLTRFADWTGSMLFATLGVRVAAGLHPYHLIVTNVAGPTEPLHLLGARLRALYPQLPLFEHEGLGIAVFSYAGRIGFSLIADWELVTDLPELASLLSRSFDELRDAALRRDASGVRSPAPSRSGPPRDDAARSDGAARRNA
jgi:WS/DGAT/MGAT family acyltransferase